MTGVAPVLRIDWRFLLDDPRPRVVAVAEQSAVRPLGDAFGSLGSPATAVLDARQVVDGADVVVALDPDRDATQWLLAARSREGTILVETTSRLARRRLARRLRRADLLVTQYGCWPSVTAATRFVPLTDRRAVIAAARSAKNHRRQVIGTALARLGVGSLLFREAATIATDPKRGRRPAPLRVAFGEDGKGSMTLVTPRFGSSRHVIALCEDGNGRRLVVKSPRLPGDDVQMEREARGLSVGGGTDSRRPTLVAHHERFGQRWLIQTFADGVPLTRRDVAAEPSRWMSAAQRWLEEMPVGAPSSPDDDGRADRLLQPALDLLVAATDREPELRPLLADARAAVADIRRTAIPTVAEHGDFRPPNLIVDGSGSIVAVDWELAEAAGLPLHDLAFFHAYVTDVAPHMRGEAECAGADVVRSMGIDSELFEPLRTVAMLRQLANVAERGTGTATMLEPALAESDVARSWFALLLDRRQLGTR